MWRALQWMMVAVLCCAASTAGPPPAARLLEAQTLFEEASRLQRAARYTSAIKKSEQALRLREAALGEHHPDVAGSLNQLASLYEGQAIFAPAEPLYELALAIQQATLGQHHPDVAVTLHNLATLCFSQGLYARAQFLHERALAIREVALGLNHPDVAASLYNLAALHKAQGLYPRAEPLFKRALAIQEAVLGPAHPDVAASLNGLALLYFDQGLYAQAEPLLTRALGIREAALGSRHPDVPDSLNNLATLYKAQGMYVRAEPLSKRALAIQEAALGPRHPGVAVTLHNLALLYEQQGLYARAEPLAQRALSIQEAVLGPHHPDVATSLSSLASLHFNQGLRAQAELLYERALAIREAVFGTHHPDVAASLTNLAALYFDQGLYVRAEPLFKRSLAIQEAALGPHHPRVGALLHSLAQLRLVQHRLDAAVPLLTRAFFISEQRLRQEALSFSESRLAGFLQHLRSEEEHLYSLLRAHPHDAGVQRLALTAVLLRKGRSIEEIADTSRAIYRGLGAQDRGTLERLSALRTQLAQLSLAGAGLLPPADYQRRLQALTDQGDALEADLARRSAPLRTLTALPPPAEIVDWVAASLSPGSALVEFIAYLDRPLVPKAGTRKAQSASEMRYLALVLFPNARIRVLDLGPAAPIDQAASTLRDALARRDTGYLRPAQALHALAFQPLLPLLTDIHHLFLAPDAQLGLIPFATLHDGKGFLIDSFDFAYLTSGKDLLSRAKDRPPASSVVVFADPAVEASPSAESTGSADVASIAQRIPALARFFSTLRTGLARRSWLPLPGTRWEAEAIQRLIPQAQLFLGPAATKQQLLRLTSPGILHIATHGFFLDDDESLTDSRALGNFGAPGGDAPSQRPQDPLLRSGLVLSGAHAASTLDSPVNAGARAENSLVTALELTGLDLWGTQLVVLSACDTGRGDVKPGQGVYGLRRAFLVAGAETVVMSLWKVDDDSTRLLMEDFYRQLMAGKGRADALNDAMRTFRKTRPHPYYWAPFISLGQEAPLRSLAPLTSERADVAPSSAQAS